MISNAKNVATNGADIIPILFRTYSQIITTWFQNDAKMMPIWCQHDANIMAKWNQCDTNIMTTRSKHMSNICNTYINVKQYKQTNKHTNKQTNKQTNKYTSRTHPNTHPRTHTHTHTHQNNIPTSFQHHPNIITESSTSSSSSSNHVNMMPFLFKHRHRKILQWQFVFRLRPEQINTLFTNYHVGVHGFRYLFETCEFRVCGIQLLVQKDACWLSDSNDLLRNTSRLSAELNYVLTKDNVLRNMPSEEPNHNIIKWLTPLSGSPIPLPPLLFKQCELS